MPYIKKQDAEKIADFLLDLRFEIKEDIADANISNKDGKYDSFIKENESKVSEIECILKELFK